jgi:hypothetical protein
MQKVLYSTFRVVGREPTAAEGATTPESLRHMNRNINTLESGSFEPADGITISGNKTEGV